MTQRSEREQALIEAAKKVLSTKGIWTVIPESAQTLNDALTPYAAYPTFCGTPELCAGAGRCPRDPACNN